MIKDCTFSVPLDHPRAIIQQKSVDWYCSLSSYKTGDRVIGCKTICRIRREHDKGKRPENQQHANGLHCRKIIRLYEMFKYSAFTITENQ